MGNFTSLHSQNAFQMQARAGHLQSPGEFLYSLLTDNETEAPGEQEDHGGWGKAVNPCHQSLYSDRSVNYRTICMPTGAVRCCSLPRQL